MIMSFTDAWKMLGEVWQLYKRFAVRKLSDQEMDEFKNAVNEIYEKHKAPFTKDIILAVIGEIGRSVKHFEKKK